MPPYDDESREAARARLQARTGQTARSNQRGGSSARRRQDPRSNPSSNRSDRQRQSGRASGERRPDGTSRSSRNRSAAPSRGRAPERMEQRNGQAGARRGGSGNRGTGRPRGQSPSRQSNDRLRRNSARLQESRPASLYHRLEEVLPSAIPPIFAIALVLLVIFLIALMIVVPSCNRNAAESAANAKSSQTASAPVEEPSAAAPSTEFDFDMDEPHEAALVKLLGKETAAKLLNKAKTNSDVMWICAHVNDYAFDGTETQYKVLKLAADEDESIPFVRSYPSSYPTASPSSDESQAISSDSPSSSVPATSIPHVYQWDQRWANTGFAGNAMGVSGSGPTCLAMVYQGLTGDKSKTPYDMGKAAEEAKAVNDKLGMKAEFLYDGAAALKLDCTELYPTYDTIRDALLTGDAIILVIEPGRFTSTESFVVIAGMADNGKAIMNDPYSIEHSSQLWDIDELAAISTAMYVYSV